MSKLFLSSVPPINHNIQNKLKEMFGNVVSAAITFALIPSVKLTQEDLPEQLLDLEAGFE